MTPEQQAALERLAADTDDEERRTSWAPVDLGPVIAGEQTAAEPAYLARTDGVRLLYPDRVHNLAGEPESGKTWLALLAALEVLEAGDGVLFIDFEDGPSTAVERLRALGGTDGVIARLTYLRPDEPLACDATADLERVLEATQPALAIVDGVNEALAIQGLDLRDNSEVAAWLTLLPRRLRQAGAAVVLLDHVVKDRESRGRFAIGAQHKLAGVDVAYSLEVKEPFARGRDGTAKLTVTKDRPGHVRGHAAPGRTPTIARLEFTSTPAGRVTLTLEPPGDSPSKPWRPTGLMENISRLLEEQPGLSVRAIRTMASGKNEHIDLALELLTSEHIRVEVRLAAACVLLAQLAEHPPQTAAHPLHLLRGGVECELAEAPSGGPALEIVERAAQGDVQRSRAGDDREPLRVEPREALREAGGRLLAQRGEPLGTVGAVLHGGRIARARLHARVRGRVPRVHGAKVSADGRGVDVELASDRAHAHAGVAQLEHLAAPRLRGRLPTGHRADYRAPQRNGVAAATPLRNG